jgi:Tol biopolymer transport system component/DNA-binding winged helix-turn-helix (wHTH) protein
VSAPSPSRLRYRFGIFEVDARSGEVWKNGVRLKIQDQPLQILLKLLECPDQLVTREELRSTLWPADTFVDFDNGLNMAIKRLREALGDLAEHPTFIETVPRHGYRFIAPVERGGQTVISGSSGVRQESRVSLVRRASTLLVGLAFLVAAGLFVYTRLQSPTSRVQRALTRLTFENGLQAGATWSPDGRFIAYSSDRGGKFDIWVRQVSGGDAVQVTRRQGNNWQPAWSPDGKYIAYRSEGHEGGLFVVPTLGGEGLERRLVAFGYHPRWSPDGSRILFRTAQFLGVNRFYVVSLDGSQPHEVLKEFTSPGGPMAIEAAWHPDGKRISMWVDDDNPGPAPNFWTVPLAGGVAVKPKIPHDVVRQLEGSALEGIQEWASEFAFNWAPSGKALYFPLTLRGAVNLWKMTVDPATLRPTAIERMTIGPGPDAQLAISPDGRKLAFTEEVQHIQAWLFPFDARRGKLAGDGHAVTPAGMTTWRQSLSADKTRLAFSCGHGGRSELWEMSLVNSHIAPVVADDQLRDQPRWSPDGKHLAYFRYNFLTHDARLVLWSPDTRHEEPISDATDTAGLYDWSPDGRELLVSQVNKVTKHSEIWLLPIAAAPNANAAGPRLFQTRITISVSSTSPAMAGGLCSRQLGTYLPSWSPSFT